jgi:isopenicillin N synthase-like dioxygenase
VLLDAEVPGISTVLLELHHVASELLLLLLRVIAVGLGASERVFESATSHAPHLTRAICYPTTGGDRGHVARGAAEHVDIDLLAVLLGATAPGLEIRTSDRWISVVPPAGHLLVTSGVMLERLSNGLTRAGIHRVTATSDRPPGRISLVHFCHVTPATVLVPLPSTITPQNPLRHLSVDAGALLDLLLWEKHADQKAGNVRPQGVPTERR